MISRPIVSISRVMFGLLRTNSHFAHLCRLLLLPLILLLPWPRLLILLKYRCHLHHLLPPQRSHLPFPPLLSLILHQPTMFLLHPLPHLSPTPPLALLAYVAKTLNTTTLLLSITLLYIPFLPLLNLPLLRKPLVIPSGSLPWMMSFVPSLAIALGILYLPAVAHQFPANGCFASNAELMAQSNATRPA